jgi:hypothetical protein
MIAMRDEAVSAFDFKYLAGSCAMFILPFSAMVSRPLAELVKNISFMFPA